MFFRSSRKWITLVSITLTSLACGTPEGVIDPASEISDARSDSGLVGRYQDGSHQNQHRFIYVNDGIRAGAGIQQAIAAVTGGAGKTLKANRTHKVRLSDDQMVTVGWFSTPRYRKHFEMWFQGEDLIGDRVIVNAGNTLPSDFFTIRPGQEQVLFGIVGNDLRVYLKNLGDKKIEVRVE